MTSSTSPGGASMTMEDSVRSAMRRRLSRRQRADRGCPRRCHPASAACQDGDDGSPAPRGGAPDRRARPVMMLTWSARLPIGKVQHSSPAPPSGVTVKDNVVAPLAPVTTEGSLADLPVRNAAENASETAFSRKTPSGGWTHVTWAQFADDVAAVAKGLIAEGLQPGDRVALMSRTRYEWTLVDFAAWSAGAVVVPIYETSSAEQVQWILSDSDAHLVIVETDAHRSTVEQVRSDLSLRDVITIDGGGLDALREKGREVPDADLDARRAGLDRASVATIIYTSGTTGRPKGCELTHGNFLDLAENAIEKLGQLVLTDNASTLLFLPLAHVFARFIEVLCVAGKARMGHSADIKTLLDDFAGFQPTFVLAVPRVFEKIFNSAEAKASAEGKGKIFLRAATVAVAYSEALDTT